MSDNSVVVDSKNSVYFETRCRSLLRRYEGEAWEPAKSAIKTISENMRRWICREPRYSVGLDSFFPLPDATNTIRSRFAIGLMRKPRFDWLVDDSELGGLRKAYFQEFDIQSDRTYTDDELVEIMTKAIVQLVNILKTKEPELDLIPPAQC
jgi:hypothetical protein